MTNVSPHPYDWYRKTAFQLGLWFGLGLGLVLGLRNKQVEFL